MSATARPVVSPQEGTFTRIRNFAIGLIFATVLLIPRLLRLRQNARSWKAVRVLMAALGAALVVAPLSVGGSWVPAVVGLALFVTGILLRAAKPRSGVSERAKAHGALVVVNGGEFQPPNASLVPVRLFVGSDNIFVLDDRLETLQEISTREISSAIAAERHGCWILRLRWADETSDFVYRGVFAEHLSRVAESTIRSVIRSPLPVLRQRRAARA